MARILPHFRDGLATIGQRKANRVRHGESVHFDRQSLRGFLAMVEREFPEELLRIKVPVKQALDNAAAKARELIQQG